MKISQKQASLLAKEILAKLKRGGIQQVPELTVAKLAVFKEKRNELIDVKAKAEQAIEKHDQTLKSITGNVKDMRAYWTVSQMVDKMKEANVPSLSDIEDKIILKQMFATDTDMETFIAAIVKEFTPKKKAIPANN